MENRKIAGKRGQAATEMLVMASFAIIFIVPLALLFLSNSNSELGNASIVQADATVRTIADDAGQVYLEGANASETVTVNYPDGIADGSVGNGVVMLQINADGRELDMVGATFANITGNLSGPRTSGLQKISLVNTDGTYVNITYSQ